MVELGSFFYDHRVTSFSVNSSLALCIDEFVFSLFGPGDEDEFECADICSGVETVLEQIISQEVTSGLQVEALIR